MLTEKGFFKNVPSLGLRRNDQLINQSVHDLSVPHLYTCIQNTIKNLPLLQA